MIDSIFIHDLITVVCFPFAEGLKLVENLLTCINLKRPITVIPKLLHCDAGMYRIKDQKDVEHRNIRQKVS